MRAFLLIYMCLMISCSPARAAQFFETLYDVPVMPGLVEVPELGLSFDKVGGRISEAGALTNHPIDENKILAFYEQSLSQMGWKKASSSDVNKMIFVREGEKLAISVEDLDGRSKVEKLVKFSLNPL